MASSAEPERQPLLGNQEDRPKEDESKSSRRKLWPTFTTISPRYRFLPWVGCFLIFTNEAEYFFKQVANMRAIEAMSCIEYYSVRDPDIAALGKHIPESLCKEDSIQKQLAKTSGLIMFFRMCAAMLGAAPLGQFADKKGRKIVLLLHKISVIVQNTLFLTIYLLYPLVPIWALYFTGASSLIGGNFDVGLAILFASYTDVMPSASERATLFFLTTSMQYVAQLTCPPIGGLLMNLDGKGGTAEVAMVVALVTAILPALAVIFLLPETLDRSKQKPTVDRPSGSRFQRKLHELKLSVSGAGLLNIFLLALAILSASVGIKANDWYGLIQYPVIKLCWSFSKAALVVSIQAGAILLNFGVLLPAYNRLGNKYIRSAAYTSFAIIIGSSIVLSSGSVVVGFSNTATIFLFGMILYTLGEGFVVATQAYISSVIEKAYLARVLTVLSIASAGGKAMASLLFPRILAIGLDTHKKLLVGLPFFGAAGLFLFAGACVVVVGFRTEIEKLSPDAEAEVEADETDLS